MGLRRLFKRFTPERKHIEKHGKLHLFGDRLHDPNLWHITRRSAAGGVANGLFWAFMPVPGQMVLSTACAIALRVNIPISFLFVWITNPVTIYPIFFACYKLGSHILNLPHKEVHFELTWGWFAHTLVDIWEPLLLGSVILGAVSACFGYYFIRWLWHFTAVRKWDERRAKNLKKKQQSGQD